LPHALSSRFLTAAYYPSSRVPRWAAEIPRQLSGSDFGEHLLGIPIASS
jgi:hypothetical protein